METYEIRDLSFSYPEQAALALDGVSLTVEKGEFLVICGPSGCGKSTLLRQLKTTLAPHGVRRGRIVFEGRELERVSRQVQAQKIGFVMQSPENQIVTDKVWHELAFGLESLGMDTPAIRRRVAEIASFFGIQDWFYQDVCQLSGGQKQLLNLASVMVMQPSVLILDEPTSQLDPIAAGEFLSALARLNRELGTTVILTEHRLEEAFSMASRVAVLDKGRLLCTGTASQVGELLAREDHQMFLAMPTAMRIWAHTGQDGRCPVTVVQGKRWLEKLAETRPITPCYTPQKAATDTQPVIKAQELWFRYEKQLPDVVRGLDLTVNKGEFLAILGGNGAGKSTALRLLAGLQTPYRGSLELSGSVGLLPQDPKTLFVKKTVAEDLEQARQSPEELEKTIRLCRLEALLDRHPYDLSGGEQQRLALAKILLLSPEILLLDEPTKGLDGEFKMFFAQVLKTLQDQGVTIVMVSHDVEFCASYASRCALFFDGAIVTQGTPREFFCGNSFYTTGANRMARDVLPQAVTAEDVILSLGGRLPEIKEEAQEPPALPRREKGKKKLPLPRKVLAAVCTVIAAACFLKAVMATDLTAAMAQGSLTAEGKQSLLLYAVLLAALTGLALAVSRKAPPQVRPQGAPQGKKLPKRTIAAAAAIVLLIPLTLYLGVYRLGVRRYYFVALLVLLECMAPFALIFEGRKPQPRELVVIAVLCALGVAGRTALFMLPQFKPVLALVIISGVALGAETGFLVGAVSMFLSNMLFSQGPWTPWQMFAMGLAGFLAGVLFRKGLLGRTRVSLSLFGFFAAVFIYGGIMNPAAMLMWAQEPNWALVFSYYVTGLPMDLVHGGATALFLWVAAVPMLEKLDRIKVKYGLVEQKGDSYEL